jgi:hypothetical protein
LSVFQPRGKFPNEFRGVSGSLPPVFRSISNVAVLPRQFVFRVPLLAQSFDAGYRYQPPLCNTLSF